MKKIAIWIFECIKQLIRYISNNIEGIIIIAVVILFIKYDGWGLLKENTSDDFRIEQQLYLPMFFGSIGGYCFIIIQTLTRLSSTKTHKNARIKFTFIGAIAGIASVNLLNPTGNVSQIIILALIAGLSGVSYLSRNSLVDSKIEGEIMDKWDEELKKLQEAKKAQQKASEDLINEKAKYKRSQQDYASMTSKSTNLLYDIIMKKNEEE